MATSLQELDRTAKAVGVDIEAARRFVDDVYDTITEGFTDDDFQRLEGTILKALEMLKRAAQSAEVVQLIARLRIALEGVQDGLPPDPARRPTREELAARFAAGMESLGY